MYHFLKLEFAKLEFDMELKFTKIKFLKKVHLELEFMELKFLAIYNLLPVFQTLSLPFPHVTLTKERKRRNPQPQLLTI